MAKNTRPKTERLFEQVDSFRQFVDVLGRHGERTAFSYYVGKEIQTLTYEQFQRQILAQTAGMKQAGLAGKRIAVIGETSPAWLATYISTILCGGVAIPMDRELAVEEIENFLTFAEADCVFFSESFIEKFDHLASSHPTVKMLVPFSDKPCPYEDGSRFMSYTALLEKGQAGANSDDLPSDEDTDRLAVLLFTSGTTGSSKCVMLSEKNVISTVCAACATVEFEPDDTVVSVLPVHHTYELMCLLGELLYGCHIAINDSLRHVMRNFATFKPTALVLVPLFIATIDKRIWDEARKSGRDKILYRALKLSRVMRKTGIDMRQKLFASVRQVFGGRLKKIISGGAPLNPRLVEEFEEFGVYISEGYGITECSPLLSVTPYYAPKRGSVGPAVPTCEIKIDGDEINTAGYPEGEICAKGSNVMLGYFKNPEATAEVFTEDGWFRTGDIGYMDRDGYVFITGRKKYVIVLENGKNVFPEEIEEHLAEVPGIAESVVLGRKVPGGTEIILTAVVFPDMSAFPIGTGNDIIESTIRERIGKMNKNLTTYKQIRNVEFRYTEFEKTTSRKIKRNLVQ